MKHIAEIIREQLQEDLFIRTHEAEIIQHYIRRSGQTLKKPAGSVRCDQTTAARNEVAAPANL